MEQKNDAVAAHVQLARLLAASKRFPQAAKHYDAALRLLEEVQVAAVSDGNQQSEPCGLHLPLAYWKILFELAHVKVQLRERADAIAMYRRIVEHQPQFAEAHANLAAQLMIEGELERALHHCSAALAIAPDFKEAHYNMNVLLRRATRQDEAIARYWDLIEQAAGEQLRPNLVGNQSISTIPGATDHENARIAPVKVSVVCVKWGSKYGAEYVNKLFSSLTRNSSSTTSHPPWEDTSSSISTATEIDFVCLTDDLNGVLTTHANLRCVPLEPEWSGWWNKLQVFSPRVSQLLKHDKCLFVDLDTVIVGSVDELLQWEIPNGKVALLKTDNMVNEQRRDGYNSSMMMWRNESGKSPFEHVYQQLHDHFGIVSRFIYKFDHWLEMALPDVLFLEDVFPESIVEYKSLDESALTPPENASIVCFPLQPKPHDASASWIQQHWQ
ncbi:hypothetical protein Gpo141_00003929 [Globisporangium polare]